MTQNTTIDPTSVESIETALNALGLRLEGGAWDRPAIAAGQLLAVAELIAQTHGHQAGQKALGEQMADPDNITPLGALEAISLAGRTGRDEVLHGYYGTIVALGSAMDIGTSDLRGGLLETRLARTLTQVENSMHDVSTLTAALTTALEEVGRLRRLDNAL
ncbi:hypothetical protein ACOMD4_37490 [Streptomyces anulatus]|uniref:hypothetical protein n=1 Tax=Streptomyces anulatus TaxID=1892 RepID=UPI003B7C8A1F